MSDAQNPTQRMLKKVGIGFFVLAIFLCGSLLHHGVICGLSGDIRCALAVDAAILSLFCFIGSIQAQLWEKSGR